MAPPEESRIWARRDQSAARPPQVNNACTMRAAPTEADRKLWWHLRHRVMTPRTHFRRQVRVGRYIADFASHREKLIVEVDGSQHLQNVTLDLERTKYLQSRGYRVLRYWNNEVLSNIDGVLDDIQRAITTTPTPDPSPQGGGE
jgi:very-short-patch-repair endonuclease